MNPIILTDLPRLARAIDDLLVAHHGLRASLREGAPPWDTSLPDAMKILGQGPVFHLWNECRLVEQLRAAWTGEANPSPPVTAHDPDAPGP
jgi:hypothetical protein